MKISEQFRVAESNIQVVEIIHPREVGEPTPQVCWSFWNLLPYRIICWSWSWGFKWPYFRTCLLTQTSWLPYIIEHGGLEISPGCPVRKSNINSVGWNHTVQIVVHLNITPMHLFFGCVSMSRHRNHVVKKRIDFNVVQNETEIIKLKYDTF